MQTTTKIDIRAVIAVAWLMSSIVLSWIIFDELGARGLLWMSIHHVFCIVGCGYEIIRHHKKNQSIHR